MFRFSRLSCSILLAVAYLLISQSVFAAKKSPETFDSWLKKYHAWDVYEQELAGKDRTDATQLDRARTLLLLGQPDKAAGLLGQTFVDPALEHQRLILLARSQRLQGKYKDCVFTWLTFVQTAPKKDYLPLIVKEPGLGLFFENMWKQWFWEAYFTQNPALYESRRALMDQMVRLGEEAWPTDLFWKQVRTIQSDVSILFPRTPIEEPLVSTDRGRIGKALAYWSLGFWDQGDALLNRMADPQRAAFWRSFALLLGHPENILTPEISGDMSGTTATSQAFFTLFSPTIRSLATWVLAPPDAPSWPSFAQQLQNQEPAQAMAMIEQEQGSVFLLQPIREGLAVWRAALEFQADTLSDVDSIWNTLTASSKTPPLLLRLACSILGGHPEMPVDFHQATLLTYLAGASGKESSEKVRAPFWEKPTPKADYPLDYLRNYIALTSQIKTSPTHDASVQLAFLFPQSPAAQKALLFLARHANTAGNKTLAWSYLQKIKTKNLDQNDRIEFLLARAGMEMELGYEDAALKDYGILMQENPDRIPLAKQLKLALLAQQKRQWTWAQGILEKLWDKRALTDEQTRAEILFWLGEGAQSQGKDQKALAYYLRLAWNYPKQNIWAVTAMYRAGLMYEKRGSFETAKRLYTTVLKNSDRASQKKAAKTRIATVDAGLKQQKNTAPLPLF